MKTFDVLVIGGGPGGYVAAIRAASMGKKTALVEQDSLGGVCLNWGCIPTKSLLRNAEVLREVRECAQFGIAAKLESADYGAAYTRSREVSEKLVKGIGYLMKKNNITVFHDTAVFQAQKEVLLQNTKEVLTAKHIIIAAGAHPQRLKMLNYASEAILDSKKALQLQKAPKSILIIGAGAIGMEFATLFRSYGAEVTVVEMLDCVLPGEDREISALVEAEYKKSGIEIFTDTKLCNAQARPGEVVATVERAGRQQELRAQYLLCATGVVPNSQKLGLQKCGCRLDARGYVAVDANMRTSVDGVYAIGDITGKLALAHAASAQGILAADHLCGKKITPINYNNIPKCTYGLPECASAGLTEQTAIARGFDVGVAVFPLSVNGKALAYGYTAGMAKLVYDKKYGQLLGAHLAGVHVSEMIWGIAGYLGVEMTVDEMANVVHPHPTMSEAIMEAAHIAAGHPIHL